MADYFQTNLVHLIGKAEVTPGTAIATANADFNIRCRNVEITGTVEMDDDGAKAATGDHTEVESLPGIRTCQISFSMPWAWSGVAATPPLFTKFLKGCGLVETVHGATGVSWVPQKAGDAATMTLEAYGVEIGASPVAYKYVVAGAMGTFTLGAEKIGGPLMLNFTFTGKLNAISAVANGSILELTSPDTTLGETLLNDTFTVGGVAECISSFQLDVGNTVEPVYCQSEATGIQYYRISARKPRFSFNPLTQAIGVNDVFTKVTSPTIEAVSLAQASSHLTLAIPRAQNISIGQGSREGLDHWEYNMRALANTAGSTAAEKENTFELLQGSKT